MGILAASLLAMLQQGSATPPPASPPNPCAAEEFAAFDFWVGEWDVYQTGTETQVATSRIEKVSNGCAVRETWMPLRGGTGSSLTTLDPQTGTWHQLWVGAQPGRVLFEGGPVDGAMILTGYWGQDQQGQPILVRMTYTLGEDGSVRQYGQASSDHGQSWSDSFDLTYRPKAG
ncbi:hypothetical protein OZN62_02795 [Aurantiacibacter sp. MUD11]|uniref:hypothetical protein n=1 Tax=Aurantiacibacter sp. MUD11 TaxID=3003265 RepID=UPI0022AA92CF|nr:hypothetical protein [Aurantiacibacter sp. MUD11]WAT18526.1 hypothetical protein OZN62_02795 [Aurantiacibacter sp. MUD11]